MTETMLPRGEEYTRYRLSDLLATRPTPPVPADLEEFWQATHDEFADPDVDVRIECDESGTGRPVQRISFVSSTGDRVTAWLVGPAPGAAVRGGLVVGHGYGGRDAPEPEIVPGTMVAVFPVAPGLPDNPGGLPSTEHVLAGIGDRNRYAHRFCVADIWRAATVLLRRYPQAADALDFRGGSFGGGIGALALPWDGRFRRAVLDVPSFGDYPTRLTRRSTGSCEAVRRHLMEAPGDGAMLAYFDAATAARSITIPVLVAAALVDPAVDPRGQFAIYRALSGTKQLVVRTAGHTELDRERVEEPTVEAAKQLFLAAAEPAELVPVIRADLVAGTDDAEGATSEPAVGRPGA